MCCGSKRSAWRPARSTPGVATSPARPAVVPTASVPLETGPSRPGVTRTRLRYSDSASIRLKGPITGRAYSFSGAEPVQEVDVRDAAIFVRSVRSRLSQL
jgi:hypothetical protein